MSCLVRTTHDTAKQKDTFTCIRSFLALFGFHHSLLGRDRGADVARVGNATFTHGAKVGLETSLASLFLLYRWEAVVLSHRLGLDRRVKEYKVKYDQVTSPLSLQDTFHLKLPMSWVRSA